MLRIILFDLLLAGSCGYALWRGGQPERIIGAAFVVAYLATLASYSSLATRFYGLELGPLLVDLGLLAVLVAVALRADRFWPMIVAALQLDTIAAHLLKAADAETIRVTYALMIAVWSYPMLLLLAFGTFRHRLRLERGGDRDWSRRRRPGAGSIPAAD